MKKAIATAFLLAGTSAWAQPTIVENSFYVGMGASSNDYDGIGDDSVGLQIFGGLDVLRDGNFGLAAELGFMDAGEADDTVIRGGTPVRVQADAEGVWATAVGTYAVAPQFDLIGRAGFDFGDDDGPMLGAGLGFDLTNQIQLRGEFVAREHIDSLQANLLFRF